jgi:hypothetical protein
MCFDFLNALHYSEIMMKNIDRGISESIARHHEERKG